MHELSIAAALVKTLSDYLEAHEDQRILSVQLKVGRLSGIDCGALEYAWPMALETAPVRLGREIKLVMELTKIQHRCRECGKTLESERWIHECPFCGKNALHRESGKEFMIQSIEVEHV